MKGDFTRFSHQPGRGYAGVLMQQGRVTLDADWNEQFDIDDHRLRVQTVDTIGQACAPEGAAGFGVTLTPDGSDLLIGAGRIYVDGILVELDHADWVDATLDVAGNGQARLVAPDGARVWLGESAHPRPVGSGHWLELAASDGEDRALARVAEDPQAEDGTVAVTVELFADPPGEGGAVRARQLVTYRTQPFFPAEDPDLGAPLDPDAWTGQRHLVYLDVWRRHVTAVEDPAIREVALGGPDTATRVQTVWAVRLLADGARPLDVGEIGCHDRLEAWETLTAPRDARMSAQAEAEVEPDDPCAVAPEAGYRGLENRLYRVEIHDPGPLGLASFKWSRDNGSVVTAITGFPDADTVRVASLGKDRTLGFGAGDRVEVVSEETELSGTPGTLATVQGEPDPGERTITLDVDVRAIHEGQRRLRLRRWDQAGEEPQTRTDWTTLEKGVQVAFGGEPATADAYFRTGDYWVVPARVATGDVEGFVAAPPRGITHHAARLALVTWPAGEAGGAGLRHVADCRRQFPSLCGLPRGGGEGCATVTVGDGVTSVGDFTDLQSAIDAVPVDGPAQVSVLPGTYTLHEPVQVGHARLSIVGCGHATRLIAPQQPALRLLGCRDVRLRDLTVEAGTPLPAVIVARCREVRIDGCTITNARHPDQAPHEPVVNPPRWASIVPQVTAGLVGIGPAVDATASALVWLEDNVLVGDPAVAVDVAGVTLEGNVARGTLRVRDGSANVVVRGNDVVGANGPGVALGGLLPGEPLSTHATGVRSVAITGNRIVAMTGSGITTVTAEPDEDERAGAVTAELRRLEGGGAKAVRFDRTNEEVAAARHVAARDDRGMMLAEASPAVGDVTDVAVTGNVIADCAAGGLAAHLEAEAAGGVVLRDVVRVRIHDNEIERNAGQRGCGVYLSGCEAVEVHRNAVAGNGSAGGTFVDFTLGVPATGSAFTRNGFAFELDDAEATIAPWFGLVLPGGLTATLPGPTRRVELTLGAFTSGTVRAFDDEAGDGSEIAASAYAAEGLRRVTLESPAGQFIRSLRIEPEAWSAGGATAHPEGGQPFGTGFLLSVCAGEACHGYQGGIVSVAAGPDDDEPSGPALRVHDNTVSAPAGQALLFVGVGSVSVADNHLATLGHTVQSAAFADAAGTDLPVPWLPRTVYVASAGRAAEFGNRAGLRTKHEVNVGKGASAVRGEPAPGGRIAFRANHVVHAPTREARDDQDGPRVETVLASTVLACLDDVAVVDNHFAMDDQLTRVGANTIAMGVTARAGDNRWAETLGRAGFSAAVAGAWFAYATGNQATHCVLVAGAHTREDNQQVVELVHGQDCAAAQFDIGSGVAGLFAPQGGQT